MNNVLMFKNIEQKHSMGLNWKRTASSQTVKNNTIQHHFFEVAVFSWATKPTKPRRPIADHRRFEARHTEGGRAVDRRHAQEGGTRGPKLQEQMDRILNGLWLWLWLLLGQTNNWKHKWKTICCNGWIYVGFLEVSCWNMLKPFGFDDMITQLKCTRGCQASRLALETLRSKVIPGSRPVARLVSDASKHVAQLGWIYKVFQSLVLGFEHIWFNMV